MQAAVFDIETSDLAAVGSGFCLCAVVRPLSGKPKVFRYDDYKCKPAHEGRMLKALLGELSKYDLLIGHNITKFDLNYLKSRALVFNLPWTLRPLVYDTLAAFRRCGFLTRPNGFGKPTASLAFVVDFLGLPQKKTGIYPEQHWRAVWQEGDDKRQALTDIVEHCIADVEMNLKVYEKLLASDGNPTIKRMK